jgi:hypothetical protein
MSTYERKSLAFKSTAKMINFSVEVFLKPEMGQKLNLLHQTSN